MLWRMRERYYWFLVTWVLLPGRWYSIRRLWTAIDAVRTAPWVRAKRVHTGEVIICDYCERGYHIHDDRTCRCTVAEWCQCTVDHMHVHYVDTAT